MSKTLTITVENVPDKLIEEMWTAAVASAPKKMSMEPVDHIKINYSLLHFGTKRNVLEMLTTGVKVAAIIHYGQTHN